MRSEICNGEVLEEVWSQHFPIPPDEYVRQPGRWTARLSDDLTKRYGSAEASNYTYVLCAEYIERVLGLPEGLD